MFEQDAIDDEEVQDDEDSDMYEEDESADISAEVLERYGAVGLMLYKRIQASPMFGDLDGQFLKQIISIYIQHRHQSTAASASTLSKLVGILLPLKEIRELNRHDSCDRKQAIVYKACLDIWDGYLTQNDSPMYTTFQQEFIPAAIQMYKTMSDTVHKLMSRQIQAMLANLKDPDLTARSAGFLLLDSPSDYVAYYESRRREVRNLTAGTRLDMYMC